MKNSVWFNSQDHSQGRWDGTLNQYIYIFNAGDVPTDISIILPTHRCNNGQLTSLRLYDDSGTSSVEIGRLVFRGFTTSPIDLQYDIDAEAHISRIRVNSATNLIEGVVTTTDHEEASDDDTDDLYYSYTPTGTLYNQYISAGDFFKLPVQTPCHLTVHTHDSTAEFPLVICRAQYDHLYY